MAIFDISWPLKPGMTEYKNKKELFFEKIKKIDRDGVAETKISIGSHSGTHIDAPAHFIEHGKTTDQILLNQLVGECHLLDLSHVKNKISYNDLIDYDIKKDDIILIKTTNSTSHESALFDPYFIYIDESAALYLAEKKIKALGIDYIGIERGQIGHPTHTILFKANIAIIEGLRLHSIKADNYLFVCLPLSLVGLDGAPARAILIKE